MSDDLWIVLVALTLIVFVPFDWFVAGVFMGAAWQRPRIPILTFAAIRSVGIALAATIAGALGVHSIVLYMTDGAVRLLPVPIPTVLIAVALIVISLPNLYAIRWLRATRDAMRLEGAATDD